MKRSCLCALRVLLALLILESQSILVHSAETNFWTQRHLAKVASRRGAEKEHTSKKISSALLLSERFEQSPQANLKKWPRFSNPSKADVFEKNELPQQFLKIERPIIPPQAKRTVFLLQDIHANSEAQRQLADMIEALVARQQVLLLGLEGAFGDLAMDSWRKIGCPGPLSQIADLMLAEHAISGPLHYAITSKSSIDVVGIDDQMRFNEHVLATQAAHVAQKHVKKILDQQSSKLDALKSRIYNPELKRFDAEVQQFRRGQLDQGRWAQALRVGMAPQAYPSLIQVAHLRWLEDQISIERVQIEKDQMLKSLLSVLSSDERQALARVLRANSSNGDSLASLRTLETLCSQVGLNISVYPSVRQYLDYLSGLESVEGVQLRQDLHLREKERFQQLCSNSAERKLIEIDRAWYLATRLCQFSLSSDEWSEYKREKKYFLRPDVRQLLSSFERFYDVAIERDALMAENMIRAMTKRGSQLGVLVAGGFHAEGMMRTFHKHQIAVVPMVPRLSQVPNSSSEDVLKKMHAGHWMRAAEGQPRGWFLSQNLHKGLDLMAAALLGVRRMVDPKMSEGDITRLFGSLSPQPSGAILSTRVSGSKIRVDVRQKGRPAWTVSVAVDQRYSVGGIPRVTGVSFRWLVDSQLIKRWRSQFSDFCRSWIVEHYRVLSYAFVVNNHHPRNLQERFELHPHEIDILEWMFGSEEHYVLAADRRLAIPPLTDHHLTHASRAFVQPGDMMSLNVLFMTPAPDNIDERIKKISHLNSFDQPGYLEPLLVQSLLALWLLFSQDSQSGQHLRAEIFGNPSNQMGLAVNLINSPQWKEVQSARYTGIKRGRLIKNGPRIVFSENYLHALSEAKRVWGQKLVDIYGTAKFTVPLSMSLEEFLDTLQGILLAERLWVHEAAHRDDVFSEIQKLQDEESRVMRLELISDHLISKLLGKQTGNDGQEIETMELLMHWLKQQEPKVYHVLASPNRHRVLRDLRYQRNGISIRNWINSVYQDLPVMGLPIIDRSYGKRGLKVGDIVGNIKSVMEADRPDNPGLLPASYRLRIRLSSMAPNEGEFKAKHRQQLLKGIKEAMPPQDGVKRSFSESYAVGATLSEWVGDPTSVTDLVSRRRLLFVVRPWEIPFILRFNKHLPLEARVQVVVDDRDRVAVESLVAGQNIEVSYVDGLFNSDHTTIQSDVYARFLLGLAPETMKEVVLCYSRDLSLSLDLERRLSDPKISRLMYVSLESLLGYAEVRTVPLGWILQLARVISSQA